MAVISATSLAWQFGRHKLWTVSVSSIVVNLLKTGSSNVPWRVLKDWKEGS